jgi:hypothetical protein
LDRIASCVAGASWERQDSRSYDAKR